MVSLSTLLNNLVELVNQYVYTKTETKDNFDNYIEDYIYYVNGVFSSTKNLIYFNSGSDIDLYNPQNATITTSNNILTITTSSSDEKKVSFPTIWFDKDANCYMEMTYQGGTSQPIAICFNRQSNTTWGSVSYDPSNNRFSNSLSGIRVNVSGTISVGDVFRLSRENGVSKFYQNGTLLFQATRSFTDSFRLGFYTNNGRSQSWSNIKVGYL